MNPVSRFDFKVEKATNTIYVTRYFDAPKSLVWKAWTTAEMLDKWWAPKPYKAVTLKMDFRPGGTWLYYMESPEGERHYSKLDYKQIREETSFTAADAFTTETGEVLPDFPGSDWENSFTAETDQTKVDMIIRFSSIDALDATLKMGFEEGFTAGLQNLDELLKSTQSGSK